MEKYPNPVRFHMRSPFHQLFVSLIVIVVVGVVMFMSAVYAGSKIYNFDLTVLNDITGKTGQGEIAFMKFLLVAQDISFFIVPSIIILSWINPGCQNNVLTFRTLEVRDIIMVIILAFCAFPVTGLAGDLNSRMVLPEKLHGLSEWIKGKEDYADKMLSLIIFSKTFPDLWLNLFIVAALPAIGEELIFRGILQKIFQNMFRSGNISVWVTSVIFSTIHFQFFGFLPRFLLGLMFGYLFLWRGSLWLPVIAHCINNAVPVVGVYIKGWESINAPFSGSIWDQVLLMIVPAAAGIMILNWFRSRSSGSGRSDAGETKS